MIAFVESLESGAACVLSDHSVHVHTDAGTCRQMHKNVHHPDVSVHTHTRSHTHPFTFAHQDACTSAYTDTHALGTHLYTMDQRAL